MSEDRASLNPRPIPTDTPSGAAPAAAPTAAAAVPEPSLLGQLLDGRYQVMQRLGEGMLSTVYEARHTGTGRHFAIKVLRASFTAKPQALDRFLQHARAAAQVRHPNVVSIEEFGYTPTNSVYASVELIVGDTLETVLARDGRWSWMQARPLAVQMASALNAAHMAGVVHRALKPANCFVILDPRGKREPLVKIADFGLAQVGAEASQAAPGATTTTLFGDPEYMSPEQGLGGEITHHCDIYAFGVVLYRLLGGQVPFSNPNAFQTISQHAQKPVPPLRSLDPNIPEAVEQIVMRCLGKTPEQRFGSAAELEHALSTVPANAVGGGQAHQQGWGSPAGQTAAPGDQTQWNPAGAQAAAAPPAGDSGQRFAKFNLGGAPPVAAAAPQPAATQGPSKKPSVIVAGSIGEDGGAASGGGISGTLGAGPPAGYPQPGGHPAPGGPAAPGGYPAPGPAAPAYPPTSGAGAPPPSSSSFLASRPGLRMGLGAALPDAPAPPATIAPGMAVASPTVGPGMSAPLPAQGPPDFTRGVGAGMPAPLGGSPPMGGAPPSGMPSPGAGMPPLSAGAGMPPLSPGAGMPPPGAGAGMPSPGVGAGMPPLGAGPDPGMPPAGGMPPLRAGPGMPPPGASPDPSPYGGGGGLPPLRAGPGMPPAGPGAGQPSAGMGGLPPLRAGPGMPAPMPDPQAPSDGMRRGVGPGMPPRDGMDGLPVGGPSPGMPVRRGVGPGMPAPREDGPSPISGSNPVMASRASLPPDMGRSDRHASTGATVVEYDQDDEPKKRPLLIVGIGLAVILGGAGLGWLIVGNMDGPEGDVAKVTRAQKAQEVEPDRDEPEPEEEPEDEPEIIQPKKKKKVVKPALTYEQQLSSMKVRIRKRCAGVGEGPVDIDSFVVKDGGPAIAPKIKPKGPVGNCARRIVEGMRFVASERDHPMKERVNW